MARAEEIKSAINVYNTLAGLWCLALDQTAECAGLAIRVLCVRIGSGRTVPEPNIRARILASLIRSVVADTLHGSLRICLSCGLISISLLASQEIGEGLDEMCFGAKQHSANEVCRRDAGGTLDDQETASGLDEAIAIITAAIRCDIVSVNDIAAAVVCNPGERGDVRGIGNCLGGPATSFDSSHSSGQAESQSVRIEAPRVMYAYEPFLEVHDRGALVLQDLLVRMDTDEQLLAQPTGLQHGAGMT